MLVNARKLVRKMRGGAQSHLVEVEDGRFFVVKVQNNPQHRRILVNEWIAAQLLEYLQISAPTTALVNFSDQFLKNNPEVYVQLGTRRSAVSPGVHFGSCFPGDPAKVAVYDFIPDSLLEKVVNLNEFLGILVFDKWTSNADTRQSIFIRGRLSQYVRSHFDESRGTGLLALMMDHGCIFNGPHWKYEDSPLQGLYFRPIVYRHVRGWGDFEPWLDRVVHFPERAVAEIRRSTPPEWIGEDEKDLDKMLEMLIRRQKKVPYLVRACSKGRMNPFPNWN